MRLMGLASVAGNLDAMVEFAIAQFNGDGTPKDEAAAAQLFLNAARRGSAIAQDRLARILMAGRGMPADPTEAIKWHIIAKAAGASDPELDVFAAKQTQAVRDAAEKAAKKWLSTAAAALLTASRRAGRPHRAMHPLRPAQRHDRRRAQDRARAQARFRRGGEAAGLAQGPGQFRLRRRPPRRGDAVPGTDQGAARLRLSRRGRRRARRRRQDATAGSSIRSTAPPISCTAFRNSPFRSRSSARAR